MRRFALVLLSAVMIALLFIGCAGQQGYKKTENSGDRADEYPYLVKTESAAWYLAKADIELLGEDVFYKGLYAMLDDAEASGMIAYLVETCGRDTVFANWNVDPNAMETVFGKTFPELYREWAEWNAEKCGEMGIALR